LLGNGIDFVKNNGDDGSLLLISNSDQVGDYTVANDLIDDLMNLMTTTLPIHVVDYQNQNYNYYWFGGRSYYGNEYFYSNITRLTTGNYFRLLYGEGSLSGIMTSAFQSLSGFINSFDLYTKLQDGFCYGRYSLNMNANSVYLNKPILQVGKFVGEIPFIIEASGVYNSKPFSQTFILSEEEVFASDSLNEEAWTGNYIKYLENQTQTNDVVDEIVSYSISERVLSIYSAFLCLEPGRGGEICYDCYDESDLPNDVTDSLEMEGDSVLLSVYPNPFNNQVNIKINLPSSLVSENMTFKIYNILGETVKTFQVDPLQSLKNYQFIWNGRNEDGSIVASGIYFFVVTTPEKNYSVKLLLMK
jgi:Ca-activated chloride channel family protein